MNLRTRTQLMLLSLAVAATTSVMATPQRAVTTGAHNAPLTQRRSRRSADHGRHAPQRHAVLRARQQESAGPGRAPARRQRRIDSRRRRPARARALRRAHVLQRHEPLPEAGSHRVSPVDRHALRGAHQRQHELRSNGLPAADSHRQSWRHRPVAADPRGLGARGVLRPGRDRQGARRHPGGVAGGSRRRRPDPGRAASGPAQGLAVCRAHADRHARDHPELHVRPFEEVLHRLVSPRSHGRHRRRRLRSGADGKPDQIALRLDPAAILAEAADRSTMCRISQARATRSRPIPRPPRRLSASPA